MTTMTLNDNGVHEAHRDDAGIAMTKTHECSQGNASSSSRGANVC